MRIDHSAGRGVKRDEWLEARCLRVERAGRELADAAGQVNERAHMAQNGGLGRRRNITDAQVRAAESAYHSLHEEMLSVQDALFDCENELRDLRERDVNPAELLIDGERLIQQYRFVRRRARILDGLLAYLPGATQGSRTVLESLRQLQNGGVLAAPLVVPDCSFALAALDELGESA